ncbi:hypothetical protein D3C76_926760 [compost metagenome]
MRAVSGPTLDLGVHDDAWKLGGVQRQPQAGVALVQGSIDQPDVLYQVATCRAVVHPQAPVHGAGRMLERKKTRLPGADTLQLAGQKNSRGRNRCFTWGNIPAFRRHIFQVDFRFACKQFSRHEFIGGK